MRPNGHERARGSGRLRAPRCADIPPRQARWGEDPIAPVSPVTLVFAGTVNALIGRDVLLDCQMKRPKPKLGGSRVRDAFHSFAFDKVRLRREQSGTMRR